MSWLDGRLDGWVIIYYGSQESQSFTLITEHPLCPCDSCVASIPHRKCLHFNYLIGSYWSRISERCNTVVGNDGSNSVWLEHDAFKEAGDNAKKKSSVSILFLCQGHTGNRDFPRWSSPIQFSPVQSYKVLIWCAQLSCSLFWALHPQGFSHHGLTRLSLLSFTSRRQCHAKYWFSWAIQRRNPKLK